MRPEHCGRPMQKHGAVTRLLGNGSTVEIPRFHCQTCGHTMREYPPGVGQSRVTATDRRAMLLLQSRGLSCREVADEMKARVVYVSTTSVWRAVG